MAHKDSKEHQHVDGNATTKDSGETHSGTPNPDNQNKNHSTEYKSGYGGEDGEPRTGPETGKK